MRYLIISLSFGLVLFFFPVAHADSDGGMKNPCQMKHAMNPCMKKKKMSHHKERRQMMNDQMDILLQTIKLIKEGASNSKVKDKAGALEGRMQSLIGRHDKMHEEMEKKMKERYKQHNPCGKKGSHGKHGSH